jgi:hypothetical protein
LNSQKNDIAPVATFVDVFLAALGLSLDCEMFSEIEQVLRVFVSLSGVLIVGKFLEIVGN